MQTNDYAPGASGLKIDLKTGEIEINSARLQVGSLPGDPQLVTITAGQWSDYDLPANALEHYRFIGAELAKIPTECRDSAEFSTEDCSFDRDGSDIRTTLTYKRLETGEEVAARQQKAKVVGSRLTIKDGLFTIYRDGVPVIRIGDLSKAEPAQPFVLVDDQVFVSQALIEEASITKARISDNRSVKMEWCNGRYVVAGTGIGFAYVDASAETYLTARITSLEAAIVSQGQAITALNNPFAGKADQSTVDALVCRVTLAEAAIASSLQSLRAARPDH